ncbi:hypothetical protein C8F04DRAFT_75558 [Mycena alexandri]|uniref:AAA-ATPase-like domain-containing protein n=1 Tax=Mycena alexandri TaxID=1745969 RepID=A0AAD6XBK1_9AGAR|nr:hypothetical protein C8F04DRAFT_75558 [Mycena alexandri]
MASKSPHPLSPHADLMNLLDGGLLLSKDKTTEDSVALEDDTPFLIEEVFDGVVFLSSPKAKRAWLWSDGETDQESNSSDSEPGPYKRARTRSLSPISFNDDSTDTSLDSDNHMELPRTSYDFSQLRQRPETVYVDKTRCIVQFPPKFRYILLRPTRFGKTAFLSTLTQYYDTRGAENFAEHFGSLAVAESSGANGRNSQHLCLSFPFADLLVFSDITAISSRLRSHVAAQIQIFLLQYTAELQVSDPYEFVQCGTIEMFTKLFDLVRSRGYTLFVGVDEYDAPVRLRSFMHLEYPDIPEYFASPREIECLLDNYFWGPLLAASNVISKLFVTGTISLLTSSSSVNLRALDLVAPPALQLSCGFTEPEALAFSGAFLDTPLDIVDLRQACGQYIFSSPTTATEPVFHPQQLILHISELSHKSIMFFTPKLFPFLPGIFELLPEDSSDLGIVTTNGLIDLLASGTIDLDTYSAHDLNGMAVTWNVLHDLGGLTYDQEGALRVANSTVLALIHAHVDTAFADRHDLQERFFSAIYAHDTEADSTPLVELFSTILCAQMQRALANRGQSVEPTIHGIFELVMRNTRCLVRKADPAILVPPRSMPVAEIKNTVGDEVQRWALKTISLRGMWRGTHPNADVEPSIDALCELHIELMHEGEESLVTKYCVLDTGERVLVGSLLEAEPGLPVLLAVGGARVILRRHSITSGTHCTFTTSH